LGWDSDKILKLPIGESEAVQQFRAAMDDDFNTPNALAVMFELAKELRRESNIIVHGGKTEIPSEVLQQKWQTLVKLAEVLGFRELPG
jgi:cysteinyl-tRNA synthetase